MTLRINPAQQNQLADALDFNSGTATVYTGSQPGTAGTPATGTVLGVITLPASALTAAVNGTRGKNGTWQVTATGTGTAGYVRLVSATGDRRMDLAVGSEVTFDDPNIIAGGTITVTSVAITMPS
jgi:hypothetical protein